ncbi:YhcN/YlaJ family sporulation lipoprotein [Bacillus sp. Marseille-Q3570]|uniref:YhcN/YlaJ family sporulation lipoprotein n=1 Tax=Bacillus sp. Marseille-Q3570 TaxID=2963522 RepID=UPI0021B772EA|nr:YhcN/YlaJ family sporulation lipoprotein [Bacillus sp. Marseille-Q3570]
MFLKAKFLLVACLFATALVACNMGGNDNDNMGENGAETENIGDRDNGVIDNNDRAGVMNNERVRVAEKAAEKIEAMKQIEDANVFVTNENAYVAAQFTPAVKTEGEVTKEIEQEISKRVKSTDPDINNVFVSTNPEFFDRSQTYAEKFGQGEPVQGLFDEFNETIRRVFPNAR